MFENIGNFFKKMMKTEQKELLVDTTSKDAAKERLHIVLMQDRANVSADFLELMKQEIIDVIKKYIVIDEEQIDVRLTNQENEDGTTGAPSLYANIPILNIRNDIKSEVLNQNLVTKTDNLNNIDFNDKTVMIPIIDDLNESNNIDKIEKEDNLQVENNEKNVDKKEENSENVNNDEKQEKIEENVAQKENIEEIKNNLEPEEINLDEIDELETEEFDDEDDDDVTFDDLLKAAEEEEKQKAEESKKIEEEEKKEPENNKKTTSTTKKKTTGKGKGKRKHQNQLLKKENNEVVYSEGEKIKKYRVDCWNN